MFSRCALLSLGLWLAACQATPEPQPTPLASLEITEFVLAAPSATAGGAATLEFVPPTPTPQIYVVVPNDTLFTIAARLEITLDALMAANPGVDARALAPGTELLIPSGAMAATTPLPQITPVPVAARPPRCFASQAGELRCLVLVQNDGQLPLENVTGYVRLRDASGNTLADAEAVPPLNLLPVGAAMPLIASFSVAPAGWASAQAEITSAFAVQENQAQYVRVQSVNFSWEATAPAAQAAHVRGRVELAGSASSVWVLAVAYDAGGEPVGMRRWESAGQTEFDFWVYSLGPQISDVQVVAEGHP